jgi:glycogen debranching enzyme
VRFAPLLVLLAVACTVHVREPRPLRLSAPDGRVLNEFFRQGPAAAHIVLTPAPAPRIVVAFPAGNSGAGIWFEAQSGLSWQPRVVVRAEQRRDSGAWHGITAELIASGGPIRIRQTILSSIRVIRTYDDTGTAPPEVLVAPHVSGREIVWQRRRLDGAAGYYLAIQILSGAIAAARAGQPLELSPDAGGLLRLRVTALSTEKPLTPIEDDSILTARAAPDARLRSMLSFLSYEEKLLAGSWRFNTYFGRDTLMTLLLLAPVLQPSVMEAGLGAVLARLNAAGEVAHEEDVGEYAVLRRIRAGAAASDAPLLDYKMVDDDFMLALVAARYLLETPAAAARARAFLARTTRTGVTYGALLVRNLRFVVMCAAPFSRAPSWRRLVSLKDGERAGNWRDSEEGLGGGRYPYDVNGVLVPAALQAAGRLAGDGALRPYLDTATRSALSRAAAMAEVWVREAPRLFDVLVPSHAARAAAAAYARSAGVDPAPALAVLDADAAVRFRAVALDGEGRPVPVVSSDEALALLLLKPAPAEAQRIASLLGRPFPAGLMTDVGLVVANPVYAPDGLAARFDRSRYHGTVIWSWQQGMFAVALERQLGRDDLTASARAALMQARAGLRAAIAAAHTMRGAELWSWSAENGRYRVEPFGQRDADETESNAAQLWSTIPLAL